MELLDRPVSSNLLKTVFDCFAIFISAKVPVFCFTDETWESNSSFYRWIKTARVALVKLQNLLACLGYGVTWPQTPAEFIELAERRGAAAWILLSAFELC